MTTSVVALRILLEFRDDLDGDDDDVAVIRTKGHDIAPPYRRALMRWLQGIEP
jgi:hypothetical protein